jgi:hypothetical protein
MPDVFWTTDCARTANFAGAGFIPTVHGRRGLPLLPNRNRPKGSFPSLSRLPHSASRRLLEGEQGMYGFRLFNGTTG